LEKALNHITLKISVAKLIGVIGGLSLHGAFEPAEIDQWHCMYAEIRDFKPLDAQDRCPCL
jgi:hypothetical protein